MFWSACSSLQSSSERSAADYSGRSGAAGRRGGGARPNERLIIKRGPRARRVHSQRRRTNQTAGGTELGGQVQAVHISRDELVCQAIHYASTVSIELPHVVTLAPSGHSDILHSDDRWPADHTVQDL
ncbi:hypothetical protein EVAR_50856_1 [Eumeta japonica]|uniref:Uncharacterized protein n=1 Tax=Eumeta variegata TaxID=151549 RepID=A0A4C1Y5G6_EUMVA|nr:hypothetical protein EVAR_50856_1 [Eumeta japonica]